MRSEGFFFFVWGVWGRDRVRSDFGIVAASVRERSRTTVLCPMRCALRIRLEGGRLGEALWRRAVVIAGGSLVWVALCRCDCWGELGLGGAVPL